MKPHSKAMQCIVRIEASRNEGEVRAFVDGVLAALVARNERLRVCESSAAGVDIEISLRSSKRAMALATSIATILMPYSADARVTLLTDVSAITEEVLLVER